MMRKIVVAVSLLACSAAAHASYLYWQVDLEDAGTAAEWAGGYDRATVWVVNTEDPGSSRRLGDGSSEYVVTKNGQTGLITVNVSDFTTENYSFYIELASSTYSQGETTAVATSEVKTYAQLLSAGSIQQTVTLDIPSVKVWHGGSFSAAPEPTSAVLMLLGVAGLALRRKQRKSAE